MDCILQLVVDTGSGTGVREYVWCTGFVFEKALYVPYTRFSGMFYEDGLPDISALDVVGVRVRLGGVEIHSGLADEVSIERFGRGHRVRVNSRGYTLLLAQNEPYPRINTNVTLKSLCQTNLASPYITYEDPTPVVSNIYINEGSTVWEAAVAYCIKATGYYPFISGLNTVRMTAGTRRVMDYSGVKKLSVVSSLDSRYLLSDVYMKELGDTYPYEAHDASAARMDIVRTRYYPLDMQWLYDPQVGLQHKLDYSNKGVRKVGMTYMGWLGEDLMDKASGESTLTGKNINYIKVAGGRKGITTTVMCYNDRYGQKEV